MKRKLKLKRMKDGPDKGHIGVFDGEALVNLIDPESLRQCFDECEEDGWPGEDVGSKGLSDKKSVAKFLREHFHLVEDMADDLALTVLLKMRERHCDYAEALREVTRTEPGASLWRRHQQGRRT